MHVLVVRATTGDTLFEAEHDSLQGVRVWELRKILCETLHEEDYFSWILFHGHTTLEDRAFLADLARQFSTPAQLYLHAVQRPLRPPTDEERRGLIHSIQVGHRSDLWDLLSSGIRVRSTIPRGTARVNPLVSAIEANYLDETEDDELPDIVQTLLLARVDPNNAAAPPVSPLGQAIRSGDARAVEILLRYRADPSYREHDYEVPLLQAIAANALSCVRLLLAYRADPHAAEHRPPTAYSIRQEISGRRRTAREVAVPHPDIVTILQNTIEETQRNATDC